MKKYDILTRSSNGNLNHFKTVTLKGDDKADEIVNKLEEKTGFEYEWEFVEELDDDNEVVMDTGEEESTDTEDAEETEEVNESVFVEDADEDEYPRGWHRRKEFVDREGTVYQRGEEQPDLYRTKEPSEY